MVIFLGSRDTFFNHFRENVLHDALLMHCRFFFALNFRESIKALHFPPNGLYVLRWQGEGEHYMSEKLLPPFTHPALLPSLSNLHFAHQNWIQTFIFLFLGKVPTFMHT